MITRFKKIWSKAVIDNNIKELLKLYTYNATFKGTLMSKPGKGKKDIEKYFKNFAPIVKDIEFEPNEIVIKHNDIINEIGNYKFYTKKGIIEAQYNFLFIIKDKEVKILSHFSSLNLK